MSKLTFNRKYIRYLLPFVGIIFMLLGGDVFGQEEGGLNFGPSEADETAVVTSTLGWSSLVLIILSVLVVMMIIISFFYEDWKRYRLSFAVSALGIYIFSYVVETLVTRSAEVRNITPGAGGGEASLFDPQFLPDLVASVDQVNLMISIAQLV